MSVFRMALMVLGPTLALHEPPSFDCRFARTHAEKMVCSSESLSSQDRELAVFFDNTVHQAGIKGKQVRQDEQTWVTTGRVRCSEVACIERAYTMRIAELRDKSLRVADPAIYEETQPFDVAKDALVRATSLLGQRCSANFPDADTPGFARIAGFSPIILSGRSIEPRTFQQSRFAFLLVVDNEADWSVIADVVALPPANPCRCVPTMWSGCAVTGPWSPASRPPSPSCLLVGNPRQQDPSASTVERTGCARLNAMSRT